MTPDDEVIKRVMWWMERLPRWNVTIYKELYDLRFKLPRREEAIKVLGKTRQIREWLMDHMKYGNINRLIKNNAPIEIFNYVLNTREARPLSEKTIKKLKSEGPADILELLQRYGLVQ